MKRKGSLFEPIIEGQDGEDGLIESLDEDMAAINEIVTTINRYEILTFYATFFVFMLVTCLF